MSDTKIISDLFERYTHQVGQHLPRRKREDIQMEILSSLVDALEHRAQASGTLADEAMAVDVLKEFGPPHKVVSNYRPNNYLIGPKFYPAFTVVFKIILIVIAAQFLSGLISLVQLPSFDYGEVLSGFFRILDSISSEAFKALGITVLVFVLIERGMPDQDEKTLAKVSLSLQPLFEAFGGKTYQNDEEWNPLDLPAIDKRNRIYRWELIVGIFWLLALIIWINFFPQYIGIINGSDQEIHFIPILAATFSAYVIWISLFWILRIGHNIWMLVLGRKTISTRWVNIVLKVFGLLILVYMFSGPPIFGLNPEYITFHNVPSAKEALLQRKYIPIFNDGMRIALIVAMISHGIQTVFATLKEMGKTSL